MSAGQAGRRRSDAKHNFGRKPDNRDQTRTARLKLRTFNRQLSTGKKATNFSRDLSLVVVSHLIDPPLFFVRSSARCGKLQLYLGELGQPQLHLGRTVEPDPDQVSAHFQVGILQIRPVSLF